MKVTFWCDSGANIHSRNKDTVDLEDWYISDEEWNNMSEEEKYKVAEEWAWNNGLDIGWKE